MNYENSKIEEFQEVLAKERGKIHEFVGGIQQLEDIGKVFEQKLNEVEKEKEQFEAIVKVLEQKLNEVVGEKEQLEATGKLLERKLNETAGERDQFEATSKLLEQKLSQLEEGKYKLKRENQNIISDRDRIGTELEIIKNAVQEKDKQVTYLNEKIKKLEFAEKNSLLLKKIFG